MFRAPRALRCWTIGWAVLQLLLSPLASLVDAAVERAGAAARIAHVEAAGHLDCPPAHGGDCAVCRQLGGSGVPASARVAPAVAAVAGYVAGAPSAASARHPDATARPRAPPTTA